MFSLDAGPTLGADRNTEALTMSFRAPTPNVNELFLVSQINKVALLGFMYIGPKAGFYWTKSVL